MSDSHIQILRILFESLCVLESMKAANEWRSHRGEVQAYSEDDFVKLAQDTEHRIRGIAV